MFRIFNMKGFRHKVLHDLDIFCRRKVSLRLNIKILRQFIFPVII